MKKCRLSILPVDVVDENLPVFEEFKNFFDVSRIVNYTCFPSTYAKDANNVFTSNILISNAGGSFFNCHYDGTLHKNVPDGVQSLNAGTYYISFKMKSVEGTVPPLDGNSQALTKGLFNPLAVPYVHNEEYANVTCEQLINPPLTTEYQSYLAKCVLPVDADSYGFVFQLATDATTGNKVSIKEFCISTYETTEYIPYED